MKTNNNFSHIRINQINDLYLWGIANTDLKKINVNDLMSFFFIDRENVPSNLVSVSQIFNKLIAHAKNVFKIDNYTATEYAMTAILRETKGIDFMDVYKQISQTTNLISAPLSNSAKIKIIQKIISQINNENIDVSETEIIARLIKKEGLSELDAKNSLEKALQLGAVIKKEAGTFSL